MPSQEDPRCRLICIQSVAAISTAYILQTEPVQHWTRYLSIEKIVTKSSLKPSRALSDRDGEGERGFEESISRPRDNDNNTRMTRSVVVSTVAPTLVKEFNPFPYMDNLLMDPSDNLHTLIQESLLKLLTWTVSGRTCIQRGYQRMLLSLFQTPADRVHLSITSRPGQNGVADILDGKYLTLDHI